MKLSLIILGAATLASTALFAGSAHAQELTGMVIGSDVYIKRGAMTMPWDRIAQNVGAHDLKMYGDRIAFIDPSNNLWLKNGWQSPWYEQTSSVAHYALTDSRLLVVKSDKSVWYKQGAGPRSGWYGKSLASNASKAYLSPGQLLVLFTDKTLAGKVLDPALGHAVAVDGSWTVIAKDAIAAGASDTRFAYTNDQYWTRGKDGPIWQAWANGFKGIDFPVVNVKLVGDRFCWETDWTTQPGTNMNQGLDCRDGGVATGSQTSSAGVFGYNLDQFSLGANDRVVVHGNMGAGTGTKFYGWEPATGWMTLSLVGSEVTSNEQ